MHGSNSNNWSVAFYLETVDQEGSTTIMQHTLKFNLSKLSNEFINNESKIQFS